ncbi:unnamed protein product [Colias eurytheme]|nr:unnamed protein product [Colias eurytheme]
MNSSDPKKKTKRTKNKNSTNYNSQQTQPSNANPRNKDNTVDCVKHQCPLLAKDSEWVDFLESTSYDIKLKDHNNNPAGEEVQPEDDSQIKPIALMFPNLLNEDRLPLEGIVNRAISTTEVTRHLVGHKANFSFLRKVNRLIPPDKVWLESLSEKSISSNSINITEDQAFDQSAAAVDTNSKASSSTH